MLLIKFVGFININNNFIVFFFSLCEWVSSMYSKIRPSVQKHAVLG